MLTVAVEVRLVGRRKAVLEPRRVPLDLAAGATTLRLIVSSVVRSEVAAFQGRSAERSVVEVLTDGAVEEGALVGRIVSGEAEPAVPVDVEAAIDVALLAHADGLYQVVIDDVPINSLDDEVALSARSSLMFIRLVALSGG